MNFYGFQGKCMKILQIHSYSVRFLIESKNGLYLDFLTKHYKIDEMGLNLNYDKIEFI